MTITPPLPEDAHEAARALGQLRFDQVIENVASRLKTDRGLVACVMGKVEQGLPADSRVKPMQHRRPTRSQAVERQMPPTDDLFAYAPRRVPQATDRPRAPQGDQARVLLGDAAGEQYRGMTSNPAKAVRRPKKM